MPAPPDADFVVLTSRLSPDRDGGYAVAVASRLRLLCSIGIERPLLLTFDVGGADEHERENRQAFRGDPRPDIDIRNLFEEIRRDPMWLYEQARAGRADPDAAYRGIRDDHGREVVSLPVIRDDPSWHLTETAVVVRGSAGDRIVSGFGGLYLAWLRTVVAQLRARADDDERSVVVICESKQIGELIADWDDPNVRIVHTVHNSHLAAPCEPSSSLRDDGWRRWLALLDRFDAVIWPTASQENDVSERFGAYEGSIAIPTPITPDSRPRSHGGRGRDVMMVNRLVDQKRVDTAVASWPRVLQRVPDAHLHIYGDGPLRDLLQDLIDDRGLTKSVHLHGYSDRVRDAMAGSTAFLSTSSFEGQNLAIGEALASGLPVVAFDVCYGPRDYVGEGGILVAPGDTEGIASALAALLLDDTARAEMSVRAREQSRRLSPEAVGTTFARLLHDVVARRARRRTTGSAQATRPAA
ncbi:glycosyltransferase [Microbacterium sp. VKM Ac-2923]|uniref:glycosyltransferase n=1 Tax=Microbacterium sp. VKM Ac-2923 TaxID=2929476 RepID=UPI001FB2512F|nr:glycosyltransferase [Microbacterium sp. VKM Ac-2923]MCJ1709061.1 glycosyltransferase [Microbacterium sp. VKM Ac-2923]